MFRGVVCRLKRQTIPMVIVVATEEVRWRGLEGAGTSPKVHVAHAEFPTLAHLLPQGGAHHPLRQQHAVRDAGATERSFFAHEELDPTVLASDDDSCPAPGNVGGIDV